ncbi:LemA family protein [Campylobacter majalis]|uniref:LemA family protein n=1 Tax=Campylobacter majalis TaxID=2790656 RepID=UPI003D68373B
MSNFVLGVAIVLLIIVIWGINTYNTFIAKKNQVKNIRAGVDTQLKKRYDLIPNLVASVKEYMTHERETLSKITKLRSNAINGDDDFKLNNEISKLLSGIRVAVEAYPELKANENFIHLQKSLNEIEEQLNAARRAYNGSVMDLNNYIQMFPTSIIAKMFKFTKEQFFEASEIERENPNLKELFK